MADIDTALTQWSTTASSNKPTDATSVGSGLGDNLRTIQAVVRGYLAHYNNVAIASGATTDLGAAAGLVQEVSGNAVITSLGTTSAGIWKIVRFQGAATLTYNGASLVLPGGVDITTAAGDTMLAYSKGSGNWVVPFYQRVAALPMLATLADAKGDLLIATAADVFAKQAVGNLGTTLIADPTTGNGWTTWVPRAHISGLVVTNGADTANDLNISAGEATDDTNSYMMRLSSAITKRFDDPWSVGTAGGAMSGADLKAAGSIIHVWLIGKTDGTTDVMGSDHATSALNPALPAGYTLKRLIATRLCEPGLAFFKLFSVKETAGSGEFVSLTHAVDYDIDLTNTLTTARRLDALYVPLGYKVFAQIRTRILDANSVVIYYIQDPDLDDSVPSGNPPMATGNGSGPITGISDYREMRVWTNTSGQIAARSNVATTDTYQVVTMGWEWGRRL